jgi:hypothetical protein
MCPTLVSVIIKKEFTVLELSYSIIFPHYQKSESRYKKCKPALKEYLLYLTPSTPYENSP